MRKIKFLIIGSKKLQNTIDLIEEIERLGHEVDVVRLKEIIFESKNGTFSFYAENKSLENYDIYIIRSYGLNLSKAQLIINSLKGKKIVIDEVLGGAPVDDKIYQANRFANIGVPHPQTMQVLNSKKLEDAIGNFPFPIIIKPIAGSRGNGVYKADNQKEALDIIHSSKDENIVQQYIPIKNDVRVLVVGGKGIGAICRHVLPGDCRSNASLGAKIEKFALSKEMEKIAIKGVRSLGLDVAGVDMVKGKSGWMLLEVNASPQWQAFKNATGINPAKSIIAFALKKYKK